MVKRLVLLWVGLCLGLAFSQAATALTVTTTVEPDRVRPGESVVVTYEADGQVGHPDFTSLQEDFEIVDRRQSQNIAIVNGQASYQTVWTLVLMPREAGALRLPAIEFGNTSSEARTVTVVDDTSGAGGSNDEPVVQSTDPSDDILLEYSVDDPTPYANQQVVLTAQVYAAVDVEDLNLSTPSVREGRAEIDKLGGLREYQSTRNGRSYAVREQRYTLIPKAAGMLTLSPLEVTGRIGDQPMRRRVDPPQIEVVSATADPSGDTPELDPEDLLIEVDIDKSSPYVQEQVIFTVRLSRAINIENATLSAPVVSGGDAVIERIGNDRRFQATRDDRRYVVTERRFVLFPQTSGALTLEPVQLQASIPVAYSGGSTTGFWSRPLTRPVRIQSGAHELEVKSPPDGAPRPWLPAGKLTLEEQWPDRETFEVGAPITRRITVIAEELLASQLPSLEAPLPDGVKSYPEKPRRETSADDHGATAHLEQTVTLIPSRAGTFTVPAFELRWWNTRTDGLETLSLPAHTFDVTAAPGTDPAEASNTPAATSGPSTAGETLQPGLAWWVSLGLAIAWLATLVLWRRDRRAAPGTATERESGAAESRRRAVKHLRAACRGGDPETTRDALLAWARACWPDNPPRSLGALARIVDQDMAREIALLQQALYAPGGAAWQGEDLYRAVTAYTSAPSAGDRGEALRPLYQH